MSDQNKPASPQVNRRRAWLIALSLLLTFMLLRLYLHQFPATNLDLAGYNIHHLFTGLVLLTLAGIPLMVLEGQHPALDLASITFGAGLSMALDEWVYLIVTDGSDQAYLLPVSLWGGLAMVLQAALWLLLVAYRTPASQGQ